jgi:simple sugar transport system ATP-binding protein
LLVRLRALADSGIAIVLITHKLRDALLIADDVTVLRQGSVALTGQTSNVTPGLLADAMLGHGWTDSRSLGTDSFENGIVASRMSITGRMADVVLPPDRAAGHYERTPVVRARKLSVIDDHGTLRAQDVNIDIYRAEIVGIAGVEGSGVRELLRVLGGRLSAASGAVDRPTDVGFVPEDRHRDALALDLSLTENVAMRDAGRRAGIIAWKAVRQRTARLLGEFDIRAPSPDVAAHTLSGGNQQKLVLARELEQVPQLLIVENPTRGLDLRATAAIHARLREARNAGMAIVLYSSDLDELMALADRVFAMYAGRLTETSLDRAAIGNAMLSN